MQKLKVNDEVQIIAGKDKGSKGKILSFSKDKKRIVQISVIHLLCHT